MAYTKHNMIGWIMSGMNNIPENIDSIFWIMENFMAMYIKKT